jgi:hypothetical protein
MNSLTIPYNLLINLNILSKIEKNGKITKSTNGVISIESTMRFQSLKRFISRDSRKQSVSEIKYVIEECIMHYMMIINSKFLNKTFSNTEEFYKMCELIGLLHSQLESAKIGIENLKFTYQQDKNISSELDVIILKTSNILRDMSSKFNHFCSIIPVELPKPSKPSILALDALE